MSVNETMKLAAVPFRFNSAGLCSQNAKWQFTQPGGVTGGTFMINLPKLEPGGVSVVPYLTQAISFDARQSDIQAIFDDFSPGWFVVIGGAADFTVECVGDYGGIPISAPTIDIRSDFTPKVTALQDGARWTGQDLFSLAQGEMVFDCWLQVTEAFDGRDPNLMIFFGGRPASELLPATQTGFGGRLGTLDPGETNPTLRLGSGTGSVNPGSNKGAGVAYFVLVPSA